MIDILSEEIGENNFVLLQISETHDLKGWYNKSLP